MITVTAPKGEVNQIVVDLDEGRVRDSESRLTSERGCRRGTDRVFRCGERLRGARITTGDRRDEVRITGDADPNNCGSGADRCDVSSINPGPGRDLVRIETTTRVTVNLRDGEVDTVFCGGKAGVDLRLETDADETFVDCPARPSAPAPARAGVIGRRVQRSATVLRGGIRSACRGSAGGSCAVRAYVTRRSALALGIRTRLSTYTVGRGTVTIPGTRPALVVARLTRRSASALRRRPPRALRIRVSASVRDRSGSISRAAYTVVLTG